MAYTAPVGGRLDVKTLGELGLIRALRRRVGRVAGGWRHGIGDDGAVLRPRATHDLVVTTDALVEDIHFRFRSTDPRSLGHKTLAVSLSDLGAMGARPLGFVLSLALPSRTPAARLGGFVDGLLAEARMSGCPLVGGDTVEAPAWVVTVTAFGEVRKGRALLRSGARPGDRIVVSGTLGGAALGLAMLERGRSGMLAQEARRFVERQVHPRPPYRLGEALAKRRLATAAIDISDGLARDLGHLVRESGVGASVELERLPMPRGLARLSERLRLDPVRLAVAGGEDYELLFTLPPAASPVERLGRSLGTRLTEIGIVRRGRRIIYRWGGVPVRVHDGGFEHFAARKRVKGREPRAEE